MCASAIEYSYLQAYLILPLETELLNILGDIAFTNDCNLIFVLFLLILNGL